MTEEDPLKIMRWTFRISEMRNQVSGKTHDRYPQEQNRSHKPPGQQIREEWRVGIPVSGFDPRGCLHVRFWPNSDGHSGYKTAWAEIEDGVSRERFSKCAVTFSLDRLRAKAIPSFVTPDAKGAATKVAHIQRKGGGGVVA
jgi:hypothetical protein